MGMMTLRSDTREATKLTASAAEFDGAARKETQSADWRDPFVLVSRKLHQHFGSL